MEKKSTNVCVNISRAFLCVFNLPVSETQDDLTAETWEEQ